MIVTPSVRFHINFTSIYLKQLIETSHSYTLYRKSRFLLYRKRIVLLFIGQSVNSL